MEINAVRINEVKYFQYQKLKQQLSDLWLPMLMLVTLEFKLHWQYDEFYFF